MTAQEIHQTLARLIAQKTDHRIPAEHVRLDSRLREDLGIDSLGFAELLYEIEEAFGATLDISRPEALCTVGDAIHAIAGTLQVPLAS